MTEHRGRLSRTHPLAEIAAGHCTGHLGSLRPAGIGDVAGGACWERAIRDDERVAVEFGLPRQHATDPMHVDDLLAGLAEAIELVPVIDLGSAGTGDDETAAA